MRRSTRTLLLCFAAAGAAFALAGAASAQATPSVGAAVRDVGGKTLGVIEKVVMENGAPRQVQIRDGRVLRTVPVRGLVAKDGGFVLVISKAEFLALPVVE